MKLSPEDLDALLGKKIDDPAVEAIRDAWEPDVTEIEPFVYYAFYSKGLSLHFEQGVLTTVMLYTNDGEDYQQYSFPLPDGISFSMKEAQVKAALGAPTRQGEDTYVYARPDYEMYVEFSGKDKSIATVTLLRSLPE